MFQWFSTTLPILSGVLPWQQLKKDNMRNNLILEFLRSRQQKTDLILSTKPMGYPYVDVHEFLA